MSIAIFISNRSITCEQHAKETLVALYFKTTVSLNVYILLKSSFNANVLQSTCFMTNRFLNKLLSLKIEIISYFNLSAVGDGNQSKRIENKNCGLPRTL